MTERKAQMSLEESARVVHKLVEEVGRAVKRISPHRLVTHVAMTLYDSFHGSKSQRPRAISHFPPHLLSYLLEIHSLEARKPYDDTKLIQRFDEAMKELHEYYDPYQGKMLEPEAGSLDLFMQSLAHIQFPLQEWLGKQELARAWIIFACPAIEQAAKFQSETLQGTPAAWLLFSYCMFAAATDSKGKSSVRDFSIARKWPWYSDALEAAYFRELAWTRLQMQQAFQDRLTRSPHLTFVSRPLIAIRPTYDLEIGRFVVINPGLLFETCTKRLLEICGGSDVSFGECFGAVFEKYVGSIIRHAKGIRTVFGSNDLERRIKGKSCDFLINLGDAVLLLECKAVSYTATLPTENALKGNNSTKKLNRAFQQILNSARSIRDGEFAADGIPRDVAIFAAAISWGEIYMANSGWRHEEIVRPFLEEIGLDGEIEQLSFAMKPQVVSIDSLEWIVATSQAKDIPISAILRRKNTGNYSTDGDWPAFLHKEYGLANWSFPEHDTAWDDFFAHMGIARES